jgi:hypothetical protein
MLSYFYVVFACNLPLVSPSTQAVTMFTLLPILHSFTHKFIWKLTLVLPFSYLISWINLNPTCKQSLIYPFLLSACICPPVFPSYINSSKNPKKDNIKTYFLTKCRGITVSFAMFWSTNLQFFPHVSLQSERCWG